MTLALRVRRLLGFDFSARIATARAAVEQRVAQTRDEVAGTARHIAGTIVLAILAAIAGLALVAVGLAALYVWVVATTGDVYAGLGAVAGVLVLILLVVVIALVVRGGSKRRPERVAAAARTALNQTKTTEMPAPRRDEASAEAQRASSEDDAPASTNPSPDELLAHFGTLLGTHLMSSSIHPALAEGLRHLQTAQVSRDIGDGADPLDAAASVVRDGDRKSMLAVLAGAAVLGWMAARLPRD